MPVTFIDEEHRALAKAEYEEYLKLTPDEIEAIAKSNYERSAAHYWHQGAWAKTWEELPETERQCYRRVAGIPLSELMRRAFEKARKLREADSR